MHATTYKTAFSNEKNLKENSSQELVSLSLSLSPLGNLYLYSDLEESEMLSKVLAKKIHSFFAVSESVGLLRLGLSNFSELPPSFSFWKQFSQIFITEICKHVDPNGKATPISIEFPSVRIITHREQSILLNVNSSIIHRER